MKKDHDSKLGRKIQRAFLLNSLGSNLILGLAGIAALIFFKGKTLENSRADLTVFIIAISAMVVLVVTFLLLTVRQSRHIARDISEPISKLTVCADKIANGSFDFTVDIKTGDEIENMAGSFLKIAQSLQQLKTDATALVSAAHDGRLDIRADAGAHRGGYQSIIEEMNTMLDTVKAPLDTAYDFIDRLADGEHPRDIENTYKGYYSVLLENLNKIGYSISVLKGETEKIANAGKNGEPDVRGDASGLKGVFAQVVNNINTAFDSIKEPLDVAFSYIEKIADGEDPGIPENPYGGYFARLINNLKSIRESLKILLEESLRLAEAGESGDLGQKGDLSGVKGSYAKIIDCFNRTIESIVSPINEAGTVLGRIAVNDYTVKMSDGYNGKMKEFAETINTVRDRLLGIEKVLVEVSRGNGDSLQSLQEIGKRSENDKMIPSIILMIRSIHNTVSEAEKLAAATIEGNLGVRGDESRFEGSYLHVIKALNKTMQAVAAPLEETSRVLQGLAGGNLTVEVTGEYKGEYNKIKTAMNQAVASFNELLSNINMAASQVAAGSGQVSDASQSLSQGAAEQASSVEELTSSITEVAAQTRQNAESASQASTLSSIVQEEAAQGNEKMNQMLSSMREINESSADISKIIKVIDDIAFQTNILALNAAVEAARAGQYGKGFAVVAEEVRNLAAKSAEAAKNTTALIESSTRRVETGTAIANETASMLNKISESIQQATVLVGNIASASNEQASAISQIDQGILQVSTVVQTNSATAEESAASSEELSGQANMLSALVSKFRLKNPDKIPADAVYKKNPIPEAKMSTQVPDSQKLSPAGNYGKY